MSMMDRKTITGLMISISTSNVGGARLSRTVFWVPRRRASSSDKCDRFDPADEIAQGWVEEQVIECLTVRRADELHTAFRNGAGCSGFELHARSRR